MGGYSGIWDFPSLYDDEDYETRTLTVRLSSSTTPMPVYEELKSAARTGYRDA